MKEGGIEEQLIPEDATDPILIRVCVYYFIMDTSDWFLKDLFFCFFLT